MAKAVDAWTMVTNANGVFSQFNSEQTKLKLIGKCAADDVEDFFTSKSSETPNSSGSRVR